MTSVPITKFVYPASVWPDIYKLCSSLYVCELVLQQLHTYVLVPTNVLIKFYIFVFVDYNHMAVRLLDYCLKFLLKYLLLISLISFPN